MSAKVSCVSLEVHQGRWTLQMDKLLAALTPGTRMLILNSPGNPTGWTIGSDDQRAILDHCRKHGIWIIADDVYERLIYVNGLRSAPSFLTMAEEGDRVISVNSFSKAWTMTGWRAGWMVVPPAILERLAPLIEYNTSCVAEFVQRAATVALEQGEPYVENMRARLALTKTQLVGALCQLPGVEAPEGGGSMYIFLRVAGRDNSFNLARQLVEEAGLGLAPGRAFGPEGEGWLRWCYAADLRKIELGVERLTRFLFK